MSRGMDGTSLESISISECPEQFIPRANNRKNSSEELMTELEQALDSANHCTQREKNINSGAGANAGSMADKIFVTTSTNPLSEVVWSPREGLSLKCADCSSTDKNSCLLQSTESGNIIISLPQSVDASDNNNNGTVTEGNLSLMQLPPISESENSKRVTVVSPPSTVGTMPIPVCQLRDHEQNPRPCRATEDLSRTMGVPLIDVNCIEDDISANKEMVIFSPEDIQTNVDNVRAMTDSVTTFPDKFMIPGSEIGLSTNSLSFNPEASKRELAIVEHEHGNFNEGKSFDSIEESKDVSSGDKVAESDSINEEDKRNKMIEGMPCCQYPPGCKLVAEGGGTCAEVDTIVVSQLEYESKNQPGQSQGLISKDNNASLVGASPNNSGSHIKQKIYKEKALLDREVNCNISKEAVDSHESVESSNSGGALSKGKRAWSFEHQQVIGTKKIKKQSHENPCSVSFLKKDNSFINWISNIVNGISKIDVNEVPSLAVTAEPSHPRQRNSEHLNMSHDKGQNPCCSSMGFQNIFQAMYCPNLRSLDEKSVSHGHQGAKGLNELELATGTSHISGDNYNVKLCKLIPISNQIFNKNTSQLGVCPLILPTNASANTSTSQEKSASDIGENENHESSNIACCFEKVGEHSSNSSLFQDLGSPSEAKGAKQLFSVDPNKCPEQFIQLEKNRKNRSEELMTEVEQALDSPNHSAQRKLNIDSGAGANAGSREDMIFVTTNPLSELVWSPRKGLTLKYADCSSTDKKSSLLRCTESGNILISLPQSTNPRDDNKNGTVTEGNLNSMQLPPISECEISNRVASASPPRSTVGVMPIPAFQLRDHEQNLRPCGNTEDLSRTMRVPLIDVNLIEDDKSANKEMVIFSPGGIQTIVDSVKAMTDSVRTFPEKFLIPGSEIGLSANSLSFNPEACKRDLAIVEHEHGNFDKGKSSDPIDEHFSCGDKVAESDSIDEEDKRNKIIGGMTCCQYPPGSKLVAEGGGSCAEVGAIVVLRTECESKNQPGESQGLISKDNDASLVEASPNNSGGHIKLKKYKEKALLDREVNCNISKESDDSHESVESCNSRGALSKGKRACSFEQKQAIGIKKKKQHSHESPCSASFLKQDSSFIHWISNMLNRISKFDANEVPFLAVTAEPSHPRHGNSEPLNLSHDRSHDPGCSSMGFQNIFQAIYRPSLRTLYEKSASLGHQEGAKGLKELEWTNNITHISSEEDNIKLCEVIPISNQVFNKNTIQVGEFPLILPANASVNTAACQEKPTSNNGEKHHSFNISCSFDKGGVHTFNSSLFHDLGSPSEGKGAKKLGSVDPSKYLNSVTNRSASPLESLWISRFSSKVAAPMLNSGRNQDICADIARIANCNKYLPHSQAGVVSVKDQNNLLYACEPSIDEQKDAVHRKVQIFPGDHKVSCGCKRTMIHSDQKLKSKLSPILPSQRFKKSEAMASVFARRLDALKHILLSKVTDNSTHATATCFFCGIRGHKIRDCSKLLGSELEDILQNISIYDGVEESSCVCIHCFQASHWAISCPHACSRKKSQSVCNASLADNENCCGVQPHQKNHNVTNHSGRDLLKAEKMDNQSQLVSPHTISHEENSRVGTELIVRTNVNHLIPKGRVSDSTPVKNDLPRGDFGIGVAKEKASREFILNGKQNASNSGENESKQNKISPFSNFVSRQISSIPRRIFKIINRLRFSRTDILNWRKFPTSYFRLEGFFLRLRLGKWEEGLGGTGYHVACISDGFGESSCGSSKNPFSVTIGGFNCVVDCRYVSNHDFVEEELMAWWCATLRGDGKLPSEEELNLKLKERKKYGF